MFRKKGLRKNAIPSLYLRGEEQAQEKRGTQKVLHEQGSL